MNKKLKIVTALAFALLAIPAADACTRIVYQSAGNNHFIGRSMDWFTPTATDLWAFPAGMKRDGGIGANSVSWTSKYSSVISSFYNVASADGMNEAGLGANLLYLVESDYGDYKTANKPLLSIGAWLQYVLDNFGTVAEAVDALRKESFVVVAPLLSDGLPAAGHLAIADKNGDSAIFEYLNGKLTIHHGKQYTVMTNSPPYAKQLAINAYWGNVGGENFLPGTNRASDRFARMSWMLNAVRPDVKPTEGIAETMSLTRAISVPLGMGDKQEPNIASTRWRTAADLTGKRYFYDSVHSPSVFWVDFNVINMKAGGAPMKLDIQANPLLSGEVSKHFKPAEPFKFLAPKA